MFKGQLKHRSTIFSSHFSRVIFPAVILLSLMTITATAQTTVSQGSIQGTVTDQTNAVIPNAVITIVNVATGQVVTVKTSSSGTYNSGGLPVGDYQVRVQARG